MLRRVDRREVHPREPEDPAELVGGRGAEPGEVIVEEGKGACDAVLDRLQARSPLLQLRGPVDLDAAKIAQGAVADEPEVDEIRGDLRQSVQVLHLVPDESDLPASKRLEDLRPHPRTVAEFHGVPVVPRRVVEERQDAIHPVVLVKERRQLHQEGRDLRAQLADRRVEPIEGLAGRPHRILVRDHPRELRGEQERIRHGVPPGSDGRGRRDRVEGGIDLDEIEHLAVELQELRLRRVARIEGPDPEVVGVPDAADAKLHGGAHGGGGRRLLRMTPAAVLTYLHLEVRGDNSEESQGRTRSSFTYRTSEPTSPKRICFFTPCASRTARLISGHAPRCPFGTTWTRYFAWCDSGSPS